MHKKEKKRRGFLDDRIAWLLFRRSSLQQLGHVITRVSDIKNKRRATASARRSLSPCLHLPGRSRSFSARESGVEPSHFSAASCEVRVNAGNVWRASVKERVFPRLDGEKSGSSTSETSKNLKKPPPRSTCFYKNKFIADFPAAAVSSVLRRAETSGGRGYCQRVHNGTSPKTGAAVLTDHSPCSSSVGVFNVAETLSSRRPRMQCRCTLAIRLA